jgi:hypothetical protein
MRKFEKVIKLLEQEKYRLIGKLACELAERGVNVMVAPKSHVAKEINEAIELLIKDRDTGSLKYKSKKRLSLTTGKTNERIREKGTQVLPK